MGADDHVAGAILQRIAGSRRLCRADQPRQPANFQREAGKALGKAGVVLARQQGGRRHHRHLLPGHGGDECRAQRHLGLAEANVAADQPVHRPPGGKIGQHLVDCRFLVLGLVPRKAVDKRPIARRVDNQRGGLPQRAQGGGLEQFVGNRPDAFLQPRAALLPGLAPQPVERDAIALAAIARQHIDILDRHVELVAPGVGQHHAIVQRLPDRDRLQPFVAPDTVVEVHHQIARAQRRQFGQKGIGRLAALLAADQPVAQQVLLGNDFKVGPGKPGVERQHH